MYTTIAALAAEDCDPEADDSCLTWGVLHGLAAARAHLTLWRRSNKDARALIDRIGIDAAAAEYLAAWTRITRK